MGDKSPTRGPHRLRTPRVRAWSKWFYRLLALIGLVTLLVICTPAVSWWVYAYSGPLKPPKGDILIVLSAARDDQGAISYSSYWRARAAVTAWRAGGFRSVVVSHGSPGMIEFLTAYGIPREAIVAEQQSSSTRENAVDTARLIVNMPGRRVLLTSDFHMYRAIRAFRKAGIDAAPFAVPDALQSAEHWQGRFQAFETLWIESAKIVYYKSRGWI